MEPAASFRACRWAWAAWACQTNAGGSGAFLSTQRIRFGRGSARHSSIAFRPAAVIWRRTTSTGLTPAFMGVALEMLAVWGCCTGATLLAHGFNVDMLAGLVRDGLANAHREPVNVAGRIINAAPLGIPN